MANLGIDIPDYPDEGCRKATEHQGEQSHCLNCPFTRCTYDTDLRSARNNQIVELYLKGGKTIKALAEIFNVSSKTIRRAIKENEAVLSR